VSKSPQPGQVLPQGVPGSIKKRQLLNDQELKADLCREYGERFLALDWWEDALEFFQKGHAAQGLEKVKNHSLETGDAYLLARLGVPQDPLTWRRLATRAQELGKFRFARRAYEMSGEADKAAAMAALISGAETEKAPEQD
jgi:hypothetical protein